MEFKILTQMKLSYESKQNFMELYEHETQLLYEINQALQLLQNDVSGSNLQKYLVRYTQLIEAPHALLDDEVVTMSKVIEVLNPTEINDLVKNIVDIKRIF